jgi:hypothetical protein
MELFDDAWLAAAADALRDLPAVEGADVVIDYVVSGAPGGKVTVGATLEHGRLTRLETGASPEADVTVSLSAPTAMALLTGELTPDAGYMNGSLKVEGDHPRWLLDLRVSRAAALTALGPVAAATEPLA